jgi:hypothetical protein
MRKQLIDLRLISFMSPLLLGCSLVAVTSEVRAQTVYACQYTHATGYQWERGTWVQSGFKLDKPFFIRLAKSGQIELESIANLIGTSPSSSPSCYKAALDPIIGCGSLGVSIHLNTKTLEGGIASVYGGLHSPIRLQNGQTYRDSVHASLFTCQVIPR